MKPLSAQRVIDVTQNVAGPFERPGAGDDTRHWTPQIGDGMSATYATFNRPGEEAFRGEGVTHCADCDGPLFRGQTTVVVGGGDSALQEALALAAYSDTLHLVHRDGAFTANAALVEQVRATPNVLPIMNATVTALQGNGILAAATIRERDGTERELRCVGFIACVGLAPATAFLSGCDFAHAGRACHRGREPANVVAPLLCGRRRARRFRRTIDGCCRGCGAGGRCHLQRSGQELVFLRRREAPPVRRSAIKAG